MAASNVMTPDVASSEEVQQIKDLFGRLDKNASGVVRKEELESVLKKFCGDEFTSEDFRILFESVAVDSSGNVKINDFIDTIFRSLDQRAGSSRGFLANVIKPQPTVDMIRDRASPKFEGSIDDFRERYKNDATVQERLRNKVKVCPACGKGCAIVMTGCNACGQSLVDTPLSYTDNIFTSFVYGIAKGKFPYTLSMRAQSDTLLAFDDPLAMSACHMDCIPTDVYIPDARYLFIDPLKGLELLNRLYYYCADVCLEQFWGNDAFRRKIWCGERPPSREEIVDIAMTGFNYPPSMYQLHLQFICTPFLPLHDQLVADGKHLVKGRFITTEYLRKVLALGDKVKAHVDEQTDLASLLGKAEAFGISQEKAHEDCIGKYYRLRSRFASAYADDEFECLVKDRQVFNRKTGEVQPSADAVQIQKQDTLALQNYGRPYKAPDNDKSNCTYYKFAKSPEDVASFDAWKPALGAGSGSLTILDIASERIDEFHKVAEQTIAGSRDKAAGPGCLRFDLFRDQATTERYYVLECYLDDDAAASHGKAAQREAWSAFEKSGGMSVRARVRLDSTSIPGAWPFQGGTGSGAKQPGMVLIVQVTIKPDTVNDFYTTMREDALGSRAEPGCLRIDVLRTKDDPNAFVFVECFEDTQALEFHKTTPHCKAWQAFSATSVAKKEPTIRAECNTISGTWAFQH